MSVDGGFVGQQPVEASGERIGIGQLLHGDNIVLLCTKEVAGNAAGFYRIAQHQGGNAAGISSDGGMGAGADEHPAPGNVALEFHAVVIIKENYSPCRRSLLGVNQIGIYDFCGSLTNVIHRPNPLHLIVCFELFGNALTLSHLL